MAAASGSFPRSGLTARSPVLPVATRNPATPLRSVPPAPTSAPDPIEQAEFSHYEDSGGISGRPGSRDSGETTLSTRMRLQEAATTIAEQSDKIRNLREQVERLNQVYNKTGTERPLSNIASGIASGNVTTSRGGRSNLSTSAPTLRERHRNRYYLDEIRLKFYLLNLELPELGKLTDLRTGLTFLQRTGFSLLLYRQQVHLLLKSNLNKKPLNQMRLFQDLKQLLRQASLRMHHSLLIHSNLLLTSKQPRDSTDTITKLHILVESLETLVVPMVP